MKIIRVGIWHTSPAATFRLKGHLSAQNEMQCSWAVSSGAIPAELLHKDPVDLIVVHHNNDILELLRTIRGMKSRPKIAITASSKLGVEEVGLLRKLGVSSLLKVPRTSEEEPVFLKALAVTAKGGENEELALFSKLVKGRNLRPTIVNDRIIRPEEISRGQGGRIIHSLDASLNGYYAVA